jgi:DNA transposition AAA+ family ATPase
MIQELEKVEIQGALKIYCEQKGSQNKAANSLLNVSSATVSKIINGDWGLINEVMWRNLSAQLGIKSKFWNIVETRDYRLLNALLGDSQAESNVLAIEGEAGTGKSLISRNYSESHPNVFLICCGEHWNRKTFAQAMLRSMGRSADEDTIVNMMEVIIADIQKLEKPLIIIDEADKLSDQTLYFFITLYNQLEDRCGIILLATDYLGKRIHRGVRLNRKGFKEIYSRLGRKFIALHGANANDITDICIANGVSDRSTIQAIIKDSENDLRRVKRKIHGVLKNRNSDLVTK